MVRRICFTISCMLFLGILGCHVFDNVESPWWNEKIAPTWKSFCQMARNEFSRTTTQNSVSTRSTNNASLQVSNQNPVAIDADQSRMLPSNRVKKGDQIQAVLVYRATVGNEQLCRDDRLQIFDDKGGNYVEIKQFELDRSLPGQGTSEHITKFIVPRKAPAGKYMLSSKIATKSGDVKAIKNYTFSIN